MYSDRVKTGIFSADLLPNQVEFCVCSDVHIACDRDGRNDYVFSDDGRPLSGEAHTLYQFCEKVGVSGREGKFYDGKHVLVLLGDIVNGENGYFDTYTSRAFRLLRETLAPYLAYGNILYVVGNHDKSAKFFSTVSQFPKKSVIETIEEMSRKEKTFVLHGVTFEHGHKFDHLCTGKNFLGMMGTFASDVVANLLNADLEDLLRGRDRYYDHGEENSLRTVPRDTRVDTMNSECRRVANGALKLLSKTDNSNVIVCGHTHQQPVKIQVPHGGRKLTYMNTGKFARDGYISFVVEKTVRNGREVWDLID